MWVNPWDQGNMSSIRLTQGKNVPNRECRTKSKNLFPILLSFSSAEAKSPPCSWHNFALSEVLLVCAPHCPRVKNGPCVTVCLFICVGRACGRGFVCLCVMQGGCWRMKRWTRRARAGGGVGGGVPAPRTLFGKL